MGAAQTVVFIILQERYGAVSDFCQCVFGTFQCGILGTVFHHHNFNKALADFGINKFF